MLKRLSSRSQLAREHAHLADDLAGGQVAIDAHLAGQAEGAAHRAADLGGDAEGRARLARPLSRRVSGMKTDSISLPSCELEQELGRAVGRSLRRRTTSGVPIRKSARRAPRAARGRGRSSPRSRRRRGGGSTGRSAGRGSAARPMRGRAPLERGKIELGDVRWRSLSASARRLRSWRKERYPVYYAAGGRPPAATVRPPGRQHPFL